MISRLGVAECRQMHEWESRNGCEITSLLNFSEGEASKRQSRTRTYAQHRARRQLTQTIHPHVHAQLYCM